MNFDGISLHFVISTIGGIGLGTLLIYFSQEIADITGGFFGTSFIRDLDKPYAYKILGAVFVIVNLGIFLVALFQ